MVNILNQMTNILADSVNDYLFVKFSRKKGVFSCPLCEVVDGVYMEDYVVKNKNRKTTYTKETFQAFLQTKLDFGKILHFAVLKAGATPSPVLINLLAKYQIP